MIAGAFGTRFGWRHAVSQFNVNSNKYFRCEGDLVVVGATNQHVRAESIFIDSWQRSNMNFLPTYLHIYLPTYLPIYHILVYIMGTCFPYPTWYCNVFASLTGAYMPVYIIAIKLRVIIFVVFLIGDRFWTVLRESKTHKRDWNISLESFHTIRYKPFVDGAGI